MDNVLFGRIGHKHADGAERIRAIVSATLERLGLYDDVIDIGLDFNVGVGGKRLDRGAAAEAQCGARAAQARRITIIFNRPLPGLDQRLQEQIVRDVLKRGARDGRKPAIIWVLRSPRCAQPFRPRRGVRPRHAGRGRDACGTREKRYL